METKTVPARKMITYHAEGMQFNYRVVGVCVDDGHVLMHKVEGEDFWSLPGGRCELLEPSAEALARELREELEAEVRVERLLWLVENFFRYDGRNFHELGLYFKVELPPDYPHLDKAVTFHGDEGGQRLLFRWFPVDKLEHERVFPTFLRQRMAQLPESIVHLVHTDVDEKA